MQMGEESLGGAIKKRWQDNNKKLTVRTDEISNPIFEVGHN